MQKAWPKDKVSSSSKFRRIFSSAHLRPKGRAHSSSSLNDISCSHPGYPFLSIRFTCPRFRHELHVTLQEILQIGFHYRFKAAACCSHLSRTRARELSRLKSNLIRIAGPPLTTPFISSAKVTKPNNSREFNSIGTRTSGLPLTISLIVFGSLFFYLSLSLSLSDPSCHRPSDL